MMQNPYEIKDVILKVENVNLAYSNRKILRDVNFEIHDVVRPNMTQGQIASFIGRSGIGKTQLFKILAGLNEPNSGTVKIDIDLHPVKAGEVGVVYQNYILFNHRTIFDNLRLGLDFSGQKLTSAQKFDIIKDYAQKFDLSEHLKKYPMQLSGGQKQRVSIIQQILTGNKFILLDEPFSGLDMIMVDKVIELLNKIACTHEYNTLIIVSHDVASALAISDTVFLMGNEPGKEGATIIQKIDMMSLGLAWEPEIRTKPEFHKLIVDIKDKI
jgi:ABC-type nitrate/sulfonate/bicarbonate transport system ATPase subunit